MTVLVAIGGVWFAWAQIKASRELRIEEVKPYVVMYVRPGELSKGWWAEFTIVNLGVTAAYGVTLSADPPFTQVSPPREQDINDSKLMRTGIELLAPHDPLKFNFDVLNQRFKAVKAGTAPAAHVVTIEYKDRLGNRYKDTYTLDLMSLEGLSWSVPKDPPAPPRPRAHER